MFSLKWFKTAVSLYTYVMQRSLYLKDRSNNKSNTMHITVNKLRTESW